MKLQRIISMALMGSALTIVFGCASQPTAKDEQNVQAKVAEAPKVKSRADLAQESVQLIQNSKLTAEQKQKLTALRTEISEKLNANAEKSLQLRSVLMREVLSDEYNAKEVRAIENDMRKLSEERLATMFKGVHAANDIIGRADDRKKLMEDMMNFEESDARRNQ